MVKQSELFRAVNVMLIELYPEHMVYIQECKKDFCPKSFLIELVRVSTRDICRMSVEKTIYYTITCFSTKDEYYRTNPEELAEIQEKILEYLQIGYLRVGNRAIKVKASSGGMEKSRAYIDLQFEFTDDRADANAAEPLITSVTNNIRSKEE